MENSKRKIFIGGLPANITESQLKDHFIKYGNVRLDQGCLRYFSKVLPMFDINTGFKNIVDADIDTGLRKY